MSASCHVVMCCVAALCPSEVGPRLGSVQGCTTLLMENKETHHRSMKYTAMQHGTPKYIAVQHMAMQILTVLIIAIVFAVTITIIALRRLNSKVS